MQIRAPRWRQTLRNARTSPRRVRLISTDSRPTVTVRNEPGRGRSSARTAQNQERSKTCSHSAAHQPASVYVGPGSVRSRLDGVTPRAACSGVVVTGGSPCWSCASGGVLLEGGGAGVEGRHAATAAAPRPRFQRLNSLG